MAFDRFPLRTLGEDPRNPLPRGSWPATLPAVAQLLDHGLDLGAATVLVGENGSGKSTLIEGIALAYGLSPEGGSTGAPRLDRPELAFHDMSHGESFLALAADRFRGPGLWLLDEPESALSFSGCLGLLGILNDLLAEGGSQVIMSTHSPLLAALPGAQVQEVGPWGMRPRQWGELDLVENWKAFLDAPERYLRHL